MSVDAAVFDAYGTLFDVAAAARAAAQEPAFAAIRDSWPELAETWRRKQLEYTWLRAVTGYHTDFWQVTQDGLDWALAAAGHDDAALRERLLALYRELAAYPEVPAMLRALKARGVSTAILSNGSQAMLDAAVASAGIGGDLDAVLSVDRVGVFKPSARVYALVREALGARPARTLFVSSNGWDVASAAAYGFATLWVNRAGAPADRIPDPPAAQAADLSALPEHVARLAAPAPPPAQPAVFTTDDGLRLAYRDEGRRDGPVLLCLAGLTRNMADFDPVVRDFADRARIVRLDARGRGASDHDPNWENYNVLREGQDAIALLDHLGVERAGILGTSRGGLIAMMLARDHRARLAGVCLNDVGPAIDPQGLAHIFSYLGIPPDHPDHDAAADALWAATAQTFPGVPRVRWRLHAERIWEATGEGLALRYDPKLRQALEAQAQSGMGGDLWPLFDALDGLPLALIHGENSDILHPDTAAEMRRRRPDMDYALVPRRGHVPFLDEAESRAALAAFLDRLG